MIISDTKQFVFLHNPKAAGTSIRQNILLPHDTRHNFFWGMASGGSLKRPIDKAHLALEDFKVVFPDTYSILQDYFVFAFVRDPYERYISSFHEYIKHNHTNMDIGSLKHKETMEMLDNFIANQLTKNRIRHVYKYRHFIPQHFILYHKNKCMVDYIGRVSTLNRDITNISKLLDLGITPKLGELNRRPQTTNAKQDMLLPRTKDLIRRLYELDFMYFGFDEHI